MIALHRQYRPQMFFAICKHVIVMFIQGEELHDERENVKYRILNTSKNDILVNKLIYILANS